MLIFKNNVVLKIKVNYAGFVLNKILLDIITILAVQHRKYPQKIPYIHKTGSSYNPEVEHLNTRKLPSEVVDKVRQKSPIIFCFFKNFSVELLACLET